MEVPGLWARRLSFFAAVAATALCGTAMMAAIVSGAGITRLELVILVLFVPTFGWVAIAFWNAVIGFVLSGLRRDPLTLRPTVVPTVRGGAPLGGRTALVLPARNEDVEAVLARVAWMVDSLVSTGHGSAFDIHLLSDTDRPDLVAAEAKAWSAFHEHHAGTVGLHYRRREDNAGRKAGNIWEFCERAGGDYDYLVVLDADSLMRGDTLVTLVRTMDANPGAGLLQTVPVPGPQRSRFGRFVEFAGRAYGPMLATGQAFWQGDAANYWGHNAILRRDPFVRHCRLPVLPGAPPLGGEILSHDFVEAALMRRAGWGVYLLATLDGSWEDVPANLVDFARRDRRWAQGSLQHLRLLGMKGLHPVSRLHFVLGAMGYVSSLLWLLLLVAGTAYVAGVGGTPDPALAPVAGLGWTSGGAWPSLLALTGGLLFFPKVLGVTLALGAADRFGGVFRLVLRAVGEAAFAVVVAPIMMMFHARFVGEILSGRSVPWAGQARVGRSVPWGEALAAGGWITVVGALWALGTWLVSPLFCAWMAPIFAGLVATVPVTRWTSGAAGGPPAPLAPGRAEDRLSLSDPMRTADWRGGTVNDRYDAERGLFELRRRRPLYVAGATGPTGVPDRDVLVASAEGIAEDTLERLRTASEGPLHVVVTAHRARALGLHAGPGPVALALPDGAGPGDVLYLASSPSALVDRHDMLRPATDAEAQSLGLARQGYLLPSVVSATLRVPTPPAVEDAVQRGEILRVHADHVRRALETPRLAVSPVSEAPVPLQYAEDARFVLFREEHALVEHVAILIGERERWPDPVPVRLHSACLTGDLFGSLKCDCGEQLRLSLGHFQQRGGGVLLYLQQEGRGIGLGNKLRAYALQDGGLDTVDADCALGFGPDERTYDAALDMLRHLDIRRVQLLTNNPEKLRAVERGGVEVLDRMPLHGTLNRYNLPYVKAKVQRAGHWLGDMLSGASGRGS
jgi:membrane glycosyltransferase